MSDIVEETRELLAVRIRQRERGHDGAVLDTERRLANRTEPLIAEIEKLRIELARREGELLSLRLGQSTKPTSHIVDVKDRK